MSASPNPIFAKAWLLALLLTAAAAMLPTDAGANGRVARLMKQIADPYEIALGTAPSTPVVGALHLTMTVTEVESGTLILDADVTVAASGPGADSVEIGPLTAENSLSNPMFYDLTTSVDRLGVWTFTVSVDSELGPASADFALEVQRPSPLSGFFTWVTVALFFALVGAGLLPYLRDRVKKGRRGAASR